MTVAGPKRSASADAGARGFERPPEGRLLEQRLELRGPVGFAYERAIGFAKPPHTHDRPMLVCPRATCRMIVATARERFALDRRRVLWMPAAVVHDNACESAIYDTLALFPAEREVDRMIANNRLGRVERERLKRTAFAVPCSPWLDELIDRYIGERILGRHASRTSRRALEQQLLDELAWLAFRDRLRAPERRAQRDDDGDDIVAALDFIEAHLFEELELRAIADAARTSGSTLLRRFRARLQVTPAAYVRDRRLDEAAALLARGDHSVGDVALLVGYEEVSAFARAFRRRFGTSPSAVSVSRQRPAPIAR